MMINIGCYCVDIENGSDFAEFSITFDDPLSAYESFATRTEYIGGRISITIIDRKLEFVTSFDLDYLRAFTNGLTELYNNLRGSVRLVDWEYMMAVDFKVLDRGQGLIAITGEFGEYRISPEPDEEKDRFQFAIATTVKGLRTDQSYLPEVIRQLNDLLRMYNV